MDELRFTLVGDGRFDRALVPILGWVLRECGVTIPIQGSWADLGRLPRPARGLRDRVQAAVGLYRADLLFVHRDAESRPSRERNAEISRAVAAAAKDAAVPPHVPVVPVRMTEAWLLFDERLIRQAAGNPHGTNALALPSSVRWESLPDPKQVLQSALKTASDLNGRRQARLDTAALSHRIADLATDFSALRGLAAFDRLEHDVRAVVGVLGLA